MSEASPLKKLRYDGRSKKRKWEERRSDYVAAANSEATTEEKKAKNQTFERIKRRKYVLLLSYSGASYFGMQRLINSPIHLKTYGTSVALILP